MSSRVLAAAAVVTAVLAGCGAQSGPHRQHVGRDRTGPAAPTPAPTITIVRSARTLAAGQAATVTAQQGVSLRVQASRPSVSRVRLSSSYGYPPAHGYYVTFTVTVVNTGTLPVDIGPANFRARIAGQGSVTTDDGNAPYSGAPEQLDTTQVDPGQTLRGPVTFDVRRPHGTLSYLPDRSAAVEWRF